MTDPAALARDLRVLSQCAERIARSLEDGLASLAKSEAVMSHGDPMQTKLTLTQAEAAEQLGVHLRTLQRMRAAGQGPKALRVRGAVRYRRADVERYLEGKKS